MQCVSSNDEYMKEKSRRKEVSWSPHTKHEHQQYHQYITKEVILEEQKVCKATPQEKSSTASNTMHQKIHHSTVVQQQKNSCVQKRGKE